MRSQIRPVSPIILLEMKALIQHPATLVVLAFVILIGAWSVIVTAALRHRAESVPVSIESHTPQR
ncbi:MAG: hypothetical protein ACSHYF_09210 [Verrucomicrobiaceae bacterium]